MTLTLLTAFILLLDDPKKEPAYVAEVKAIQKQAESELNKFYKEFEKKYEEAPTKDQNTLRVQASEKSKELYAPHVSKIFELLQPRAGEKEAVDGLIWITERSRLDFKRQKQAVDLLQKYHLVHPKVIEMTYYNKHSGLPWVSQFLRAQLESPFLPSEQRHRILAALAVSLQKQATIPLMKEEFPNSDIMGTKLDAGSELNSLSQRDVPKLEAEAIERFTELKAKYAEKDLRGVNCGKLAESSIFEIQNLKVGKQAPELAGEDLDGVAFKLSDYRGKVVMISFWATWCGPCMALVPHEKEIVETFKNRPFALIGVNSDPFKKTALKTVEKEKINWRSFWCGEKGPNADLPMSWNVTGWPTVYVIDHEGLIRVKHGAHVGTALDQRIEELVKIAESKAKK